MATTKKSRTKSKSVAKTTTSRSRAGVRAMTRQPSEALIIFAAICITFLLLVDTYYIYQLALILD